MVLFFPIISSMPIKNCTIVRESSSKSHAKGVKNEESRLDMNADSHLDPREGELGVRNTELFFLAVLPAALHDMCVPV